MTDHVKPNQVSRQAFSQYEIIRECGSCNMFAVSDVQHLAKLWGLHALAALTRDEYIDILKNYAAYKDRARC